MEAPCLRLPVVSDDDDPALGGELPRDALPLQAPGVGVPGHGLGLLGLAQALEQPHAAPVGVEGIDVVDDDELVAVSVELTYMPKGVALPSIQQALPSSTARTERLLARPPARPGSAGGSGLAKARRYSSSRS